MRDRPTLRALELFVAVVEHGSISAAAVAEQMGQPGLSAQIKALEQHYRTTLLERSARGVRPTPTGQLVADYGRRTLALVDELGRIVAELEGLSTGRLVFGSSSTVGEQFLPVYLGQFHAAHPGVELEVRIANTDETIRLVLEREIDFAFVGRRPAHPELVEEPCFTDAVVAFVAPGDPLLREPPHTPRELSGRQFVLRERGSATRDLALECLRAAGCAPGHVIELGSNEAVKHAVEAGLGIGLLSTHAIEAERLAGLLVDLPLPGWTCARSFWLIRRRDRGLTRAERAFLALIAPWFDDDRSANVRQ